MRGLIIALVLATALCGAPAQAELPPLCREAERAMDLKEKIRTLTQCINAGISDRRDLALAFGLRGLAYGNLGQDDLAIQDNDQAIALDPTNPMFFDNRGWGYFETGRLDLAIQDYSQAIALNARDTYAYHYRGISYYRQGQYDKALGDMDRALSLDPRRYPSYLYRGYIFSASYNYQRAREDFAKAVELAPANPDTLDALAELLATCPDAAFQDGPRAVVLARKASSVKEDARRLATLAEALARSGRYFEAKATQEKALALAKAEGYDQESWDWLLYCQEMINRSQPCSSRKYTRVRE